ncbi:MAG: hypothetical protein Athens071416_253 [Parcubacteria group bacterium Athens0714_16]|nr:MAG: hypothetical protein Athens071416_253 [Parcubacteria group bacterium Athens0714_16]
MANFKPKEAIKVLLKSVGYQKEQDVTSSNLWDIVEERSVGEYSTEEKLRVLVSNVFGSNDEVTRLAQEAYGLAIWDESGTKWKLVASKINLKAISAVEILSGLNIETVPLKR